MALSSQKAQRSSLFPVGFIPMDHLLTMLQGVVGHLPRKKVPSMPVLNLIQWLLLTVVDPCKLITAVIIELLV